MKIKDVMAEIIAEITAEIIAEITAEITAERKNASNSCLKKNKRNFKVFRIIRLGDL